MSMMFSTPGFYCVVAESGGRIVGSNVPRRAVRDLGVGPISIDPGAQNLGVGRKLMQAVMDRANERGAAGVRLVQAAFHNRSFSLYASLGFDIREPLACMQGRTRERSIPGCAVRPATPADAGACNALSQRLHGFGRGAELAAAIAQGTARVVERGGRLTGYPPPSRSSAIPRRRPTWTFRRSSRRQNLLQGRESSCLHATTFCCAGAWQTACALCSP